MITLIEQLALEQKRTESRRSATGTSGTDAYDRNAQKYQALIRERLSQAWILPATATREMTTTVKVALHPTGELAEATLVTTSGDSAYDTAALEAAHSLRRYPVPDDRETFNRHFRSFTVSFNPDQIKGYTDLMVDGASSPHQPDASLIWLIEIAM